MIKLRKDLNIKEVSCYKNQNLEEIYNIKFEFTKLEHNNVQVENVIAVDTESSNGFLRHDKTVVGFDQEKYDRGILKTHNKTKDNIDWEDDDVKYLTMIDNSTPVGLMYMWQVGIEDGFGGIKTFVGRTWEEYREFNEALVQEVKRQWVFGFKCVNRAYENAQAEETLKGRSKKGKRKKTTYHIKLNMFVHNLGHDWQFLLSLYDNEFSYSRRAQGNVFARKARKPYKASMYLNNVLIEYRDTAVYAQKPLRDWAKDSPDCPVNKLDDFDYLTVKTPDDELSQQELEYGLNDVIIIVYIMSAERDLYGGINELPLTNTGKVRKVLYKNVCDRNKYWSFNCAFITKNYDFDEYKKRIALYQGGYTHACDEHIAKVINARCYDFNSSYPSALCNGKYPIFGYEPCDVSEFKELEKQDVENPDYRFFFKAKFKKIHSIKAHSYWSSSKCIEMDGICCDNGRIYSAKEMTVYMLDLDWYSFKQMYAWESMEVLEVEKGKADYLPKELILTILDFYGKKTSLRGIDERVSEYQSAKVCANSVYGCFVYKQVGDQVFFTEDGWQTKKLDDGGINMFHEMLREVSEHKSFGFFDLGMVCSAIARKRLFDFIIKMDNHIAYVDTDSIKGELDEDDLKFIEDYNKWIEELENKVAKEVGFDPDLFNPKDPKGNHKRLGLMDEEPSCLLKTLGAKRYVSQYGDKIKCTIAGLPKSAGSAKIKSLDDFNDDTLWTTSESKKVCCYYNDNQPIGQKWIGRDGKEYVSNDKYGVCLKPVTFDLSMSGEFIEFLNLLATGKIDRENPYFNETPRMLLLN